MTGYKQMRLQRQKALVTTIFQGDQQLANLPVAFAGRLD
jgi:hypothetical protein